MIDIDTDKMRECSKEIDILMGEYTDLIISFYNRMKNVPTVTGEWTGKSSINFFSSISGKDQNASFQLIANIKSYSSVLNDSADKFDKEIINNRIEGFIND